VIPSSAKVYIRLIHSEFLWAAHKLDPRKVGTADPSMCVCATQSEYIMLTLSSQFSFDLHLPSSWSTCTGHASLWDLHVEEVKVPEQMKPLSETTEIARCSDIVEGYNAFSKRHLALV